MSIRRFGRGYGIVISCNWHKHNPNAKDCPEKISTANLDVKANRSHAAKQGWGRGLCRGRKSYDLCPKHMDFERANLKKQDAEREARRMKRDEDRRAEKAAKKAAAAAAPKKSRARNAVPSAETAPSADSAPASL